MTVHVEKIIEAICEIDTSQTADTVTAGTSFEADLGFDSGSFIELFLILEEIIEGFELGSARLAPEDFETPAKLSTFIVRRLAEIEEAA